MGLTSALTTALTGLSAAETQIDVIGNNLANSQTVGFKSSDVVFATQFLQTLSLVAPGLNWPVDAGFVHVTESGSLSSALTSSFLPARQAVLGDFVCNPPFAVGDLVRLMRALAGEIVLSQAFQQLYDINSSGDLEVGDVIMLEKLLFEI